MTLILISRGGMAVCLSLLFTVQCAKAQSPAGGADRAATLASSYTRPAYVPPTPRQRFRDYMEHLAGPEAVLRSLAGAGITQALNTPSEWGQGAEAYGRRLASSFGGHAIAATVTYGASSVLHEDNRYFGSGLTGFGPRFKYAIVSSFTARHEDGSRHFAFSRIGGYVAGAALSRTWQPPSTRGWIHAADSFSIYVASETGFNIAREFLPGFFHTRQALAPGQGGAH